MLRKVGEKQSGGGEDGLKVEERGVVFYVVESGVSGVDAFRVLGFPEDCSDRRRSLVQTNAEKGLGMSVKLSYSFSVNPDSNDSLLTLRLCRSV